MKIFTIIIMKILKYLGIPYTLLEMKYNLITISYFGLMAHEESH